MSHNLLDRCMEAALSRGTDLSSEYSPWLPVDLLQTLLVDIHEYAGCSWFTAIDSQLKLWARFAFGHVHAQMLQVMWMQCHGMPICKGFWISDGTSKWIVMIVVSFVSLLLGCYWVAVSSFSFRFQVCSCIGIRAVILPVSIAAIRGSREKAILQPEYEKLMQQQKARNFSNGLCKDNLTFEVWLEGRIRVDFAFSSISLKLHQRITQCGQKAKIPQLRLCGWMAIRTKTIEFKKRFKTSRRNTANCSWWDLEAQAAQWRWC